MAAPSPRPSVAESAPARKKLIDFLEGKKVAEAAKLFGCSPTYVSMMRSGAATPGLALAVRIEAVTGIPCGEWVIGRRD